jgi:hypothetical protein
MNKRSILIIIGIALLAMVAGGYFYVKQVMAFQPLPTYKTTVISGKPVGASCVNKGGSLPAIAIEVIDLGADRVYLSGGSNPITKAEWESTKVVFPFMKNSERHLLFNDTCLYRSAGKPADCQGDACLEYQEHFGHTWFVMNDISGQGCYPDASGCNLDVVKPGYVSITTIDKCQELTFSGPTIYELVDERGNRYVMHATADGTPKVEGVALPQGWTLSKVAISEPLTLQPRGAGHCYYNIIRDNLVQSYHQYYFVDDVFSPGVK